ncbi:helix-turn-helix transcriptional regulator [Enterococcus dongliensis]|uniref:Helix-turn-helix transcriptional regulator n=1 Tax=Enterococcus dongliensis TaxID=2559925 RepID=A0AAP5KQ56_9ENTE|nr:helix-turn-helix transcriptional regulator [Enterococcus dongliensis]MDT2596545.1 helix-turn-helix transcriptional regulator [Enterococcus dongliensis]MDT2603610.1 helix-turn-helix transcriptional regulator [Enterococcus dongliensis]MDT2634469.1 helix-turn-helix transcriptional regulator [Enterococcus dongliensis]MDT2637330.1 helix-turn-helix transcriptional regulator [Enterococcus dongliensis]MDT2642578.1 helix-turn-helix transcriptional regulator [Enterococcus dongliensis]
MKLADKIIQERKKKGWTQAELAELVNVPFQSILEWENAQVIPDTKKIIRLSELFGVSTDYLLKDNWNESGERPENKVDSIRKVTLEEAQAFLTIKEKTARWIALGVAFCILSPIGLMLLSAGDTILSENQAVGLGLLLLVGLVTPAVALFIYSGSKTAPFAYLNDEFFEAEQHVTKMANEQKKNYSSRYTRNNILSTCLCLLSTIPLFLSFFSENDFYKVAAVCLLLVMVTFSVVIFIINGIRWESLLKLLQEGEYSQKAKKRSSVLEEVATVYWLLLTGLYLTYSFLTGNWQISWIVWPIGGVFYGIVVALVNLFVKK